MKQRLPRSAVLVCVLVASWALAETEPLPESTAGSSALEGLAWMAGSWVGETEGAEIEEQWMQPKGGLMLGLHRDVISSEKTFFEYLRIEEADDGTVTYLASPAGKPATPFRLIENEGSRATFANPEHDYPQRIIYWREGDRLHARIEGDTPEGARSSEWRYRREK